MKNGAQCSDEKYLIQSKSECQKAGTFLGLPMGGFSSSNNSFPACYYYAGNGYNNVWFNLNTNAIRQKGHQQFSAICRANEGKRNYLLNKQKYAKHYYTVYILLYIATKHIT